MERSLTRPTRTLSGGDAFDYVVNDGRAVPGTDPVSTGTVRLTVTPVADDPVAVDDTKVVNFNKAKVLEVAWKR